MVEKPPYVNDAGEDTPQKRGFHHRIYPYMDDVTVTPYIKPRKDHREIKWLITFNVEGAPPLQAEDGSVFNPTKVEVKNWPRLNRTYVTLTGRSAKGYQFRSRNFNIRGAGRYVETPEWLRPLIKEAMGHGRDD